MHTLWSCPALRDYWDKALEILGELTKCESLNDPKVCLLNIQTGLGVDPHMTEFLNKALFQVRRLVTLNWKKPSPPVVDQWVAAMANLANTEYLLAKRKGRLDKFHRTWDPWLMKFPPKQYWWSDTVENVS
ncbi:hypothetical protein XELAEV_18033122mg [Xenopus laevis]|uniref:Uncharacterized protein n=1 Tax=Xenopus laevis TaxID=8355 RepID=A0A974CK75_XENLA|nr:hypothetical protein XELAEV_18033122mg [Xenopus laevis]